ncbi:hypothetical protein V6N13_147937 [Hibiscus sabdariffa]|uniref:H15 domain-containing protein n=1 Tax=Hibiscus sabdariffa TaxID=183260 RepID=A0ABR2TX25_9ROSI
MAAATASAVSPTAKKKTVGSKKPKSASSHPPFLDMISNAILSLKERTGSSQYAIAKFIEEKYKQLPPNFRKLLLVQLKKFVASGKLVKVKASYKLPPATAKPKDASSATVKPKPKAVKAVVKPKPKKKVATPVKAKVKVPAKPKARAVTKAAKTSTPSKKAKAPAKKPKSVKSPAKKAVKKAKK